MYRPFFYYYLVSIFFLSLLFLRVDNFSSLQNDKLNQEFLQQPKNRLEQKPLPKYQLVEILDDSIEPDLSRYFFLGTKNSLGKNQSYKEKSTYQASNPKEAQNNSQAPEQNNFLQELAKSKQNIITSSQKQKKSSSKMSKEIIANLQNPDSQYFKGKSVRKLNIQMDQNGKFSVNALQFPGAEYLISVAQSIFKYWIDFIPAQMIALGFIKTDELGVMQSILVFSLQNKTTNDYDISFLKPFNSHSLNDSTLNAFSYYHMPVDKKITINMVGVEFKIYKDTLSISANFEFQLLNS